MISEEIRFHYYTNYFPTDLIYRWLTYSQPYYANKIETSSSSSSPYDKNFFLKRELSFNIKDDIYLRYKSFRELSDFQDSLRSLLPNKIDIGAIYSAPIPLLNNVKNVKILQKEFFIDIDISDYADIRPCCKEEAKICSKCWPFMACAIKFIHESLTTDFGFKHIIWIFSGRRGIHCWVCDERARFMDQTTRAAVAEYLRIFKGNKFNVSAVDFPKLSNNNNNKNNKIKEEEELHPAFKRAYEICEEYFIKIFIGNYNFFYEEDLRTRFLDIVKVKGGQKLSEKIEKNLESLLNEKFRSEKIWKNLKEIIFEHEKNYIKVGVSKVLLTVFVSFVFPRIDVEVSKQLNHLLKAPFSIHPATGNVCIPIDIEDVDNYQQIVNCPNVTKLWNEYSSLKRVKSGLGECVESDKMKRAAKFFENKFLRELEITARGIFANYEETNIFGS